MSNSNIKSSKFNERDTKIIIAQLYVAKNLNKNPSKVIKFITNNRKYFPFISDKIIEDLMIENNITQEQINKHPDVIFSDLN
jgi:hypothetical protein